MWQAVASAISTGAKASVGMTGISHIGAGPIGRTIDLVGNFIVPNATPPFDHAVHAYFCGAINREELAVVARGHGIAIDPAVATDAWRPIAKVWNRVVSSMSPRPDHTVIYAGVIHGMFDAKQIEVINRKYKMDMDLYSQCDDLFRDWPSTAEVIELENREFYNEEKANEMYVRTGGYTDEVKAAYRELGTHMPGVQDILEMTRKGCFDPEQVAALQLDAEFDKTGSSVHWLNAQGIGTSVQWKDGQPVDSIDWAKMEWRRHWIVPSPGQVYEFYNRCRPGRLDKFKDRAPGIKAFTFDDMSRHLRDAGYVPQVRQWLAAVSSSLPRIVDLRRMWYTNAIDREEFIQSYMDRGLLRADAENTAKSLDYDYQQYQYAHRYYKLDKYGEARLQSIIAAFRQGMINEDQLRSFLVFARFQENVITDIVLTETQGRRNRLVKEFTTTVKSGFYTGEMTAGQAKQTLIDGGLDSTYVSQLLDIWTLRMTLPRKVVAVAKLVEWVRAGLITVIELSQRMQTLGYSGNNIAITVAEAELKLQQDAIKRQQAEIKRKKAEDKEAKANAKEVFAAKNRFRTPAVLKRWVKESAVSLEDAMELMREMGMPEGDADKWFIDLNAV